jgi:hypothetical protein
MHASMRARAHVCACERACARAAKRPLRTARTSLSGCYALLECLVSTGSVAVLTRECTALVTVNFRARNPRVPWYPWQPLGIPWVPLEYSVGTLAYPTPERPSRTQYPSEHPSTPQIPYGDPASNSQIPLRYHAIAPSYPLLSTH